MRRIALILITPLAIVLVLAGLLRWLVVPRAERWALKELQNYSKQNLPVEITAERLNIYMLKPSAALENIQIAPKGELAKTLQPITVQAARAYVDLFQLLIGRFDISAVVVEAPVVKANLDPILDDKSPSKPLPLDQVFSLIEKLPLQKIFLHKTAVELTSEKQQLLIRIDDAGLGLFNHRKTLSARVEIPRLALTSKKFGNFSGGVQTELALMRQSLKINQLRIKVNNSEISGDGELTDFRNVTIEPQGSVRLSAQIKLADMDAEFKKVQPPLNLPGLQGQLDGKGEIKFKGLGKFSGRAQVQTRDVVVGEFEIGDASLEGVFKDRQVSISDVTVKHPSGTAKLRETQIDLTENIHYRTEAHVQGVELQKLLDSVNVKSSIVNVKVSGTIPCEGQLLGALQANCDLNLTAEHLVLQTPPKAGQKREEMLHVDALTAQGKVQLDDKHITYNAKLGLGTDQLASDGKIDYDGNYQIHFASPKVDLKNFRNIVNLKMSGQIGADGQVTGHVEDFKVQSKITAENFILEDFQLGNLSGGVRYEGDHLIFENLIGAINRTQYQGGLDLDLVHSQIQGKMKLPTADLGDVASIFEKLYKFPLTLSGPGVAEASFNGPLNFWKMSYNLTSQFRNFTFGREGFDLLTFNVESDKGDIKIQKADVQKGHSALIVTGGISPEKTLHLDAVGKNWHLEETDTFSKINSNIYGVLGFDAQVRGALDSPSVTAKGQITETVIEEQEIPNSTFGVKIDKSHLDTEVNLFGNKISGQVLIPFKTGEFPLRVKMKTREWAFSSLLGLLGGSNLVGDYDSSLTADIDLQSESGEFLKSSGDISIKQLYLKRAVNSLRNPQTIDVKFDKGLISAKNFVLEGGDNRIEIKGTNFTADNLNLSATANVELRLLHMFLPFLEDIGGTAKLSAGVTGSLRKPEILGNLSLNNGFVKIKGFPHPFEKLKSDVVFSHKRVVLNSITGQLGGGAISGDGNIVINDVHDIPTNIRAHVENATLNVPDHIRTTGKADVVFSGSWFPFTLAGTYYVSNAFIDKEFVGEEGGMTNIRQSIYLPKTLKEASFEAIVLDLQIVLEKNIVIKNSLMEGSVTGNLQVKGPPQNPILGGRLTLGKNSKLIFKDKVFDVQNGEIQFNNPNEINPDIYLSANSRVNEYDISLVAQGPAKSLAGGGIHVSSVPPLSEQDIVSLLALGVTSSSQRLDQQQVQQTSRDQQAQAGYEIGAAIIGAPINRAAQKLTGFNLQFSSSYDQIRNISVPKLTLSRKITNKWLWSASRAIGDENSYDVKLQYSINQNVSAIGSYENRDYQDSSTSLRTVEKNVQSILGLDLEYKREFK